MRLVVVLAAALAVTISTGCTREPRRASTDVPPRPRVMAALGDSVTRAFAACDRVGDCIQESWATGTAEGLDSHWRRLGHDSAEGSHNLAVSGARVAGLSAQVRAAVEVRADYVTVLIGANDACAPDEAAMTSVEDFTTSFGAAMGALAHGLPDAHILVLTIPDLARLWEVGKDRREVRRVWGAFGVCQSMLANPTDTSAAAQARRDRVRGRVEAYNAAMTAACARYTPRCRHDRGAVFTYRFDLQDVSPVDYWHPSRRGQANLAEVAWRAGFWSSGAR